MSTWSTDYCPFTCPEVDGAIDDAHEDIKELVPERLHGDLDSIIDLMTDNIKMQGTNKLRSALDDCCKDLDDALSELAQAQRRIRELEGELSNMETCYG